MEELIFSIKELIAKNGCLSAGDIERLTNLFRERGISIMALEEILNFYMAYQPCKNEIHEEAFVDKQMVSYTSNDILLQKLQDKIGECKKITRQYKDIVLSHKKIKKENNILKGCLLLAIIVTIFLILKI